MPDRFSHGTVLEKNIVSGPLIIKSIDSFEGLHSISEQWDKLLLIRQDARPELSYPWIVSYLEHCLEKEEGWLVITAWQGETLVGVLPIVIIPNKFLGKKAPILKLPHDLQTNSVELLLHPDSEFDILKSLLGAVNQYIPGWVELRFTRVADYSAVNRFIASGGTGYLHFVDLNGYGAYVEIAANAEEERARLNPHFRRNVLRAERRLCKPICNRELKVVSSKDAVGETDRFFEIEASGWKGKQGTAIKCDAKLSAFYRALVSRLTQRDWFEWHFLTAEGEPISGHMAVRLHQTIFYPKIAYNESCAYCSPGNQLFLHVLEWLADEGKVKEVDCLTDMDWHRNWSMKKRPYYDIKIFPKRVVPYLAGYFPIQFKESAKKVPGLKMTARFVRRLLASRARKR